MCGPMCLWSFCTYHSHTTRQFTQNMTYWQLLLNTVFYAIIRDKRSCWFPPKCLKDYCHFARRLSLRMKLLHKASLSSFCTDYYGHPLSVSGRPCYILPMYFFIYFFYGRLILRPWLTEVHENFTRGRPWVSLEKLGLGFFSGHP